jgi:hypothetical protein
MCLYSEVAKYTAIQIYAESRTHMCRPPCHRGYKWLYTSWPQGMDVAIWCSKYRCHTHYDNGYKGVYIYCSMRGRHISSEDLTAVMKISTFWYIMLYNPLKVNRHIRGTCRVHFQGWNIGWLSVAYMALYCIGIHYIPYDTVHKPPPGDIYIYPAIEVFLFKPMTRFEP